MGLSGLLSLFMVPVGFAEPATSQRDDTLITIARSQLAEATLDLETRTSECDRMREPLPRELFSNIDSSDDDLRTALGYFSISADNRCVKHETAQFVVAALLLEIQLQGNGGDAPHSSMTALVMESLQAEMERAAQYRELSLGLRRELDSIDRLQKPFDVIGTARALGLY